MTYLGRPVFDFAPNWVGPQQALTDDVTFDQVVAGAPAVPWTEASEAQTVLTFQFLLTRAELKTLEDFQDSVRGRLQGFWLPSWTADYRLQAGYAGSASSIDVDPVGLADLFSEWPDQYKHLCVFLGQEPVSLLLKAIQGVAAGGGAEVITLTSTLGTAVTAEMRCSRLYYVRFAERAIRYRHHTPDLVETTIRFVELPREYAAAELGSRPVWLYRATRGDQEWTWAAYPVAIGAADRTWQPAAIAHGELTFDKEFLPSETKLTLATASGAHIFRSHLASPALTPTRLQIFATEAPGFTVNLDAPFFEGEVGAPRYLPRGVIELRIATPVGAADWPVPRWMRQRLCNHQLYEETTCKVLPSLFTTVGVISALGDKYLEAAAFGDKATAEGDANWFALGDVQVGNELRMITAQAGNRLWLNASLVYAEVGDTATARRGCDLLRSTCKDVFGNLINFGGEPDVPATDPKLEALEIPAQNVGKK